VPEPERAGLLVDFGGVLTTNVFESFAAFAEEEGLPRDHIADAFRNQPEPRELLFELELGQLDARSSSRASPRRSAWRPTAPTGLATRLFAHSGPDDAMLAAVRAAKRAGVRTGLISNSWGDALEYDRDGFADLFDGWVISHEVGLRKPDPAIYGSAPRRSGCRPRRASSSTTSAATSSRRRRSAWRRSATRAPTRRSRSSSSCSGVALR
jgi:FMN phosphatase YigB (HAD superfamily)